MKNFKDLEKQQMMSLLEKDVVQLERYLVVENLMEICPRGNNKVVIIIFPYS